MLTTTEMPIHKHINRYGMLMNSNECNILQNPKFYYILYIMVKHNDSDNTFNIFSRVIWTTILIIRGHRQHNPTFISSILLNHSSDSKLDSLPV